MPPEKIYSERDLLIELHGDMKTVLSTLAANEERLKHGSAHFQQHDMALDAHNKRISIVENRACPRFPWARVGGLITAGFLIIGILISWIGAK